MQFHNGYEQFLCCLLLLLLFFLIFLGFDVDLFLFVQEIVTWVLGRV